MSSEGIKDYYVIAHGKENRYQIKVMIGYGEGFGVETVEVGGERNRAMYVLKRLLVLVTVVVPKETDVFTRPPQYTTPSSLTETVYPVE